MDRDGPGEAKWNLRDFCFWFSSLFDHPTCIICSNDSSIFELNDWKSFFTTDDVADGAVHIPCFEIIFDEHDSGSNFQDKCFRCETSFFESFHEFLCSFGMHFEDENITRKFIELIRIVGIDGYISCEKLGMIFSFHREISTFEQFTRMFRNPSGSDFIKYFKKLIFFLALTKLRRKHTYSEFESPPRWMLEGVLDRRISSDGWKLEKISD